MTWYFDAGVGNGFQEYLTMQNPDPSLPASVTITYHPDHPTNHPERFNIFPPAATPDKSMWTKIWVPLQPAIRTWMPHYCHT